MKVTLRFLEADPKWNIYATLVASFFIILLHLVGVELSVQHLVLLSILTMTHGTLLAKWIFALFVHLILYYQFGVSEVYAIAWSILALTGVHYIENHTVTTSLVSMLHDSTPARIFIQTSYYVWMAIIGYLYFRAFFTESCDYIFPRLK